MAVAKLFIVAAAVIATSAVTARAADPDFIRVNSEAGTFPAIVRCLHQGQEVVLLSDGVQCQPYRKGAAYLDKEKPDTPFDFDATRDCAKTLPRPINARRLSTD